MDDRHFRLCQQHETGARLRIRGDLSAATEGINRDDDERGRGHQCRRQHAARGTERRAPESGATPSRLPVRRSRGDRVRSARRREKEECCEQRRAGTEERSSLDRRADETQRQQREARHHQHRSDSRASPRTLRIGRGRLLDRMRTEKGPWAAARHRSKRDQHACERRDQSARKTNQQARDRHVQLEQRRPDCNPPRLPVRKRRRSHNRRLRRSCEPACEREHRRFRREHPAKITPGVSGRTQTPI